MEDKKKEAEKEDDEIDFENTYNFEILSELSMKLNTMTNQFAEEQIKLIDKYEYDPKSLEVMQPVQNFIFMALILSNIFDSKNKHIFIGSLKEIYETVKG